MFVTIGIIIFLGAAATALLLPRLVAWREASRQSAITPTPEIKVTVVEGKRREEIARLLAEKGVCSEVDFISASQGKEGYLFPDTYLFYPNTSAKRVVSAMLDDFSTRTKGMNISNNQLILASIIEREAKTDEERPTIAGVYTNRLNLGMRLDADPTVQYARDTNTMGQTPNFIFWKPITSADYKGVISTYNTYLQTGLPPTPIANPGLKSITAAAHPTDHNYFYFFHRDGQIILSKTLQEHLQKINQ